MAGYQRQRRSQNAMATFSGWPLRFVRFSRSHVPVEFDCAHEREGARGATPSPTVSESVSEGRKSLEFQPYAQDALLGVVQRPAGAYGDRCRNCAATLAGKYCHESGQSRTVHRSVAELVHDVGHAIFHVDGKLWRTLAALTLRPGQLTREYIEGRRARYVSPVSLLVFVMFLLFSAAGKPKVHGDGARHNASASASATPSTKALHAERGPVQSADANVGHVRVDEGSIESDVCAVLEPDADADTPASAAHSRENASARIRVAVEKELQGGGWKAAIRSRLNVLDRLLNEPVYREFLVYRLQSSAYKYAWLLIPLSLPVMWLLFPLRRPYVVFEHTVFVAHSISFMALGVTVLMVLDRFLPSTLTAAVVCMAPVHMYRHLRGAYGLTMLQGALRALALVVAAPCALTLWSALVIAMVVGS